MKKLGFTLIFLSFLTLNGVALADSAGNTTAIAGQAGMQKDEVTIQDLGVENPGILPTNPFYFLKEWNRSFQRRITRDPLKLANYDLDIVNQRAAEIKQLQIFSQNAEAIKGAVDSYAQNVNDLSVRLYGLKGTTSNPNVEKLVQQLTDLSLKHAELLNQIETQFTDDVELGNSLENAKDAIGEVLAQVPSHFETPAKFEARLERVISLQGTYSYAEAAIEILDRIGTSLSEEAQQNISDVTRKLEARIEQATEDNIDRVTPLMEELQLDDVLSPSSSKTEKSVPMFRALPVESVKLEPAKTEATFKILNEAR